MVDVAGNYRKIIDHVFEAAAKAGRDGTKIKLLAAAKSQSIDALRTAVAAGVTLVGENYVQEAKEKRQQIKATVEWHMIGHLQRNKTKAAVEVFDVIQSLDNVALARELDKEGSKRGKTIRALVEVNLGGEESKTGIDRNGVAALLEEIAELSNLRIEGLMTVPPFQDDPEKVRPYFRDLRELREELNESRYLNVDLQELSMGMTHDYTVAIEEGATIVRIGTALFGPRSM
jgi:pyridoxal phosphate enzyme (YggS family)